MLSFTRAQRTPRQTEPPEPARDDTADEIWIGGYTGYVGTSTLRVKLTVTSPRTSPLRVLFPWDMWVVHGFTRPNTIKASKAANFFDFVNTVQGVPIDILIKETLRLCWSGTIWYNQETKNKELKLKRWFNNQKRPPFFCTDPSEADPNNFNKALLSPFLPTTTNKDLAKPWLVLTTYNPDVDTPDEDHLFDSTIFRELADAGNQKGSWFEEDFAMLNYDDQTTLSPAQICTLPSTPAAIGMTSTEFTVDIPTQQADLDFIVRAGF